MSTTSVEGVECLLALLGGYPYLSSENTWMFAEYTDVS
jgi:hypothetical protein